MMHIFCEMSLITTFPSALLCAGRIPKELEALTELTFLQVLSNQLTGERYT